MIPSKLMPSVCALFLGLGATFAFADPVSPPIILPATINTTLTGTLPNQGTPLEIDFTLPALSHFTTYTTSYAAGGFQPNITLYNSAGDYIDSQLPSGLSPIATLNAVTNEAFDGYLNEPTLPAGSYVVTLTDFLLQQSPTATNLSDGFMFNIGSGDQNYIDEQGNSLNGNYAIVLAATPVPEPASALLLAGPCLLLLLSRKKYSPAGGNFQQR